MENITQQRKILLNVPDDVGDAIDEYKKVDMLKHDTEALIRLARLGNQYWKILGCPGITKVQGDWRNPPHNPQSA